MGSVYEKEPVDKYSMENRLKWPEQFQNELDSAIQNAERQFKENPGKLRPHTRYSVDFGMITIYPPDEALHRTRWQRLTRRKP